MIVRGLLALGIAASLTAGCTVYEVAPGVYASAPVSTFDRSWSAARGAMQEQGVLITQEDRAAGALHGTRNGIDVAALVHTQADGSVRVEFKTTNATRIDPSLINRISASYDHHMGR
jgi:hypothetical protein